MVGKLNYLVVMCSDIYFIVSVVDKFLGSSRKTHWDGAIWMSLYAIRFQEATNMLHEATDEHSKIMQSKNNPEVPMDYRRAKTTQYMSEPKGSSIHH